MTYYFRASDILSMAEKRGYDIQVVSNNVYMIRKTGEDYWHKVNGHGAVHSMNPTFYKFVTKKRATHVHRGRNVSDSDRPGTG
jgi:hypothetical protein